MKETNNKKIKTILCLSASQNFLYFVNIQLKQTPTIVFTNDKLFNLAKNNFKCKIIRLLPIHLSEEKTRIFSTFIKNFFKILFNYIIIFYSIKNIKKKDCDIDIIFSHIFSIESLQVLKISKIFNSRIILIAKNIIKNYEITKNKNFIWKLYEKILFNNLCAIKKNISHEEHDFIKININSLTFDDDLFFENIIKFEEKINFDKIKNFYYFKNNFLFNKKKDILIIDCPMNYLMQFYSQIDLNQTIANYEKIFKKKISEGMRLNFKKRLDHSVLHKNYLFDFFKTNIHDNIREINPYIPVEILIDDFNEVYSVFTDKLENKKIINLADKIIFAKK